MLCTYNDGKLFVILRTKHSSVIIPEYWYKLLVWCENGIQAEYIFSKHEKELNVSSHLVYCTYKYLEILRDL